MLDIDEAVPIDAGGVADMKSSKSSSSPAEVAGCFPLETGERTEAASSSPKSKRSTSGSLGFCGSVLRFTDWPVLVSFVRRELGGGLVGSSPSSYSSNLSRRPLS